jgi:2-dehydropantoate 2-reductase
MKLNIQPNRILIVGAGVIGSVYALQFARSGLDVTLLARGKRLETLQKEGLRYNENGTIQQIPVKSIAELADEDIYDFIFVAVRYDQADAALTAIKHNRSQTIITLTNTVGYDSWLDIVGSRLLPGFPGAGGDLKDGVLYAQFGTEPGQGTIFGEISGRTTERVNHLAGLLEQAGLNYIIEPDIKAFHISHAALAAVNRHFYTDNGMVDLETARSDSTLSKLAADIKRNIQLVEQSGIKVIPPETKQMGELPEEEIIVRYRQMLNNDFIIDVKLGNQAVSRRAEIMLLDEAFKEGRLSQRITS